MNRQKIKNFLLFFTILISLLGVFFFPSENLFQMFLSDVGFLVLFPYLAVRFALKESPRDYGFCFPALNRTLFIQFFLFLFLTLGIFLLIYAFTPLKEHYFPLTSLSRGFFFFFLYSILLGGIFSFISSMFFQGFLLFIFKKFAKEWAILLQWGCFILFLILVEDFSWDRSSFIFISLFSGAITYFSKSSFVGFLFSWFFVILVDILLLKIF